MKKKFEINIKNILINNMIILFVMYLYQFSFHFRDEIKRFIIVFRKSRTKKKIIIQIANVQIVNINFVEIDNNKNNK